MKRRALLAMGAGATAAIAGCSTITGGGGGDGSGDVGEYGEVARWAVPADPNSGLPGHGLASYAPADMLARVDGLAEADVRQLTVENSPVWDEAGVASVDRVVNVRSGLQQPARNYWVYEGEFAADEIAAGLDGQHTTASEIDTHQGFTIYEATSDTGTVGRLYALADGTAIEYRSILADTPIPGAIESVVDVGLGESETLLDRNEHARVLARELQPKLQSSLGITNPDRQEDTMSGVLASGTTVGLSGTVAERAVARAFRNPSALADAPIDEWIDAYRNNNPVQSTTTATSGRVHVTTFELPVEEVFPRPQTGAGA